MISKKPFLNWHVHFSMSATISTVHLESMSSRYTLHSMPNFLQIRSTALENELLPAHNSKTRRMRFSSPPRSILNFCKRQLSLGLSLVRQNCFERATLPFRATSATEDNRFRTVCFSSYTTFLLARVIHVQVDIAVKVGNKGEGNLICSVRVA